MATPQQTPRHSGPGPHARRRKLFGGAWIVLGFALCINGSLLIFNSVTNNPGRFYVGLALVLVGLPMIFVPALRGDRRRSRPRPNGNGA